MISIDTPPASEAAPDVRPRFAAGWIALGYAAAYLAWAGFAPASDHVRGIVAASVHLPLNLAATALFLLAARGRRVTAATRPAVQLLAATGALVVLGNLATVLQLAILGHVPSASVADVIFLLSYPLNLAAFLVLPGGGHRVDRWKLLCDAGMVLAGAGVGLWYFLLQIAAPPSASAAAVTLALVYPLADLLLLVGLITVALRQPADGNRVAVRWLAIATSLMVVSDLAMNLFVVRTGRRTVLALDALALMCGVAWVLAAEMFRRGPVDEAPPSPVRALVTARLRALLPFAAAGATYALLLVVALRHWVVPLSGLAIGAIAVSGFLGARQLLAFRRDAAMLAESAVRASEARFRSLVQQSSDLIFQTDAHGVITFASSSAARVIGYQPDALAGVALSALAHPEDAPRVERFLARAAQLAGVTSADEWRLRRPDGGDVLVEVIASNLLADPTVHGIVVNARDVGERKALLGQLEHQAFHDPLTGLANRALFYDRVQQALAVAQRERRPVMVLFLDVDDFKQVNDTLGHAEGDRLLTLIASRLRASARASDTVARLGGDEFAILVHDHHADDAGHRLVERIREQMAFPFTLRDRAVHVSASIGSATSDGGTVDGILHRADLAMYAAKRTEKGTHRAWDAAVMDADWVAGS